MIENSFIAMSWFNFCIVAFVAIYSFSKQIGLVGTNASSNEVNPPKE